MIFLFNNTQQARPTCWLLVVLLLLIGPAQAQLRPHLVQTWADKPAKNTGCNQFQADQTGTLWMTTDNGLFRYRQGQFRQFQHWPDAGNDSFFWMAVTPGGQPWVFSITHQSLLYLDLAREQLVPLPDTSRVIREVIRPYGCQSLYVHPNDSTIWIGTNTGGVFGYDPRSGAVTHLLLESDYVTVMSHDPAGKIWVATRQSGLRCYNSQTNRWTTYRPDPKNPNGLPIERVHRLFIQRDGQIVLGVRDMVILFDPVTQRCQRWRVHAHLGNPRYLASYFCQDRQQNLYFSVGNTAYQLTPDGQLTQLLHELPTALITNMLIDKDGFLWISTLDGLRQYDVQSLQTVAMPVLLDVVINGKTLANNTDTYQLTWPVGAGIPTLSLPEGQNLSLHLSPGALQIGPEVYSYRYRLAGFEIDWTTFTNNDAVSDYTLPAGQYKLEVETAVKATSGGRFGQSQTLLLNVRPLFWKTPWFLSLVGLFLLSIMGGGIWTWQRRLFLKQSLEKQATEAQQLRQLNELKTALYANVTHEFRTPLTLILNTTERLARRLAGEGPAQYAVSVIEQNAQNLLRLVDELMDVARSDAGKLVRQNTVGQPLLLVGQCVETMRPAADKKNIDLSYTNTSSNPATDYAFDQDKLSKIVYNLLTNAIKFTPDGGRISVSTSLSNNHQLTVAISDTGIGIAPDQQQRIFDRFYQVSASTTRQFEGTGLGLAFVKDLVQLLDGSITVSSTPDVGSTFTVCLPLLFIGTTTPPVRLSGNEAIETSQHNLPTGLLPTQSTDSQQLSRPLILIIEDNDTLRQYLAEELIINYQLVIAADGQQGLDLAIEHVPDLIVSDVMMPRMDGFMLVQALKTDDRTSHIPVLLLTARASLDSRLQGLATGADDYLTKPFNFAELQYRIRNCLQTRRNWQQFLSQSAAPTNSLAQPQPNAATHPDIPTREQEFLKRMRQLILTNIQQEISTDWLVAQTQLSRTQLYRKLTALTGLSVSHFINQVRLEKGRELLNTTDLNVSEVAFQVGYNSASYFTKVFTAHFGQTPTSVRS
jgi:signal transduction histidine kinase/DNA-binding response OmpR family regulator/streptogramin lyase